MPNPKTELDTSLKPFQSLKKQVDKSRKEGDTAENKCDDLRAAANRIPRLTGKAQVNFEEEMKLKGRELRFGQHGNERNGKDQKTAQNKAAKEKLQPTKNVKHHNASPLESDNSHQGQASPRRTKKHLSQVPGVLIIAGLGRTPVAQHVRFADYPSDPRGEEEEKMDPREQKALKVYNRARKEHEKAKQQFQKNPGSDIFEWQKKALGKMLDASRAYSDICKVVRKEGGEGG